MAFSAAQSNLDFAAVFATLVFPWEAVLSLSLSQIRASSALWRGANRAGAAGPWVCHFKVKGRGQVLASPFLFW